MNKIKEVLKFKILPKRIYLSCSARNKYFRAKKKRETEIWILPELVDKNKSSIDVGANTGFYTYFLSKYMKFVHAFEPHTMLADFLGKATAENVEVINKGVSNRNSVMSFYIPLKSGDLQYNIASFEKPKNQDCQYVCEQVETVTLDSRQYNNIGFLKIDVEGHEFEVLEGAVEIISKQKPIILIEILDFLDTGKNNKSLNYLLDHGYKIFVVQDKQLRNIETADTSFLRRNFICLPT